MRATMAAKMEGEASVQQQSAPEEVASTTTSISQVRVLAHIFPPPPPLCPPLDLINHPVQSRINHPIQSRINHPVQSRRLSP